MKDYNKNIRTKIAQYYVAFETNIEKKAQTTTQKNKADLIWIH